jgi:phosphatidylglycerophosphate synthase
MGAIAVLLLGDAVPLWVTYVGVALIWLAALLTLVTGYDYLRTALRHMAEDQPTAGGAE